NSDSNCFFSSRRRHTRCLSDWSSDVCSSDLSKVRPLRGSRVRFTPPPWDRLYPWSRNSRPISAPYWKARSGSHDDAAARSLGNRSEERRVGKELRCREWIALE